jgi:hypothetical protein
VKRFANDAAIIDAFQCVLAIHFEHESQRFFEVLAGLIESLSLRDGAGNLFDKRDVAALFGRFEHCGERLRHGGEVTAYFPCMRRLAATAVFLLAVPLYADSLTDMRAAVGLLRATKPIHVSIDVQRSRKNDGRFANSQFTGSATLGAIEDDAGLHITFPRPILERAERESRERAADPRKTTPTRNAIDELAATDVADAVDFARPFLRLIETAVKVSESRGVREGRPVRIIVLKLTRKLPPEATSIFSVKFTEDQMTVWLGDDNFPVAAERIQRGTAGFMFIKGSMMNRSSWNFTRYADRLVVLRSDISYAGSGFGQKGEGRSVQVVTVR